MIIKWSYLKMELSFYALPGYDKYCILLSSGQCEEVSQPPHAHRMHSGSCWVMDTRHYKAPGTDPTPLERWQSWTGRNGFLLRYTI